MIYNVATLEMQRFLCSFHTCRVKISNRDIAITPWVPASFHIAIDYIPMLCILYFGRVFSDQAFIA
ncbi:hypothetical protein RO3G_02644 [Rhizopus delemar RA 99-880]|uniref:Uncharacterized protein n=1 Tax=Rhizopus delemar (strain RA 99-880 / ATCC MYA-4621 / FGSC 9543 / NRRL 43880) TaxID=246409 RepID=I1BP10_RHIO9|nr:hypothetical protein RO3G_02644 [Rhizopus delemar RA 99-880]|eukprot:EIE77940.1 hypothetical protein RO3G_02644 [Rhizopus delemar RA 99-880]